MGFGFGRSRFFRPPGGDAQGRKFGNKKVYETPEGLPVGVDYKGPKKKVADSKAEYARLCEHRAALKRGEIIVLQTQAPLRIVVNGVKICTYIADFRIVYADRRVVVEDVKGMLTPIYKLKKRLVKAALGIDIVEIGRKPKKKKERK